MARFTAPSLWLPGFSPEPFEPRALFIEAEPTGSDPASPATENLTGKSVAEPGRLRTNWRVVTGTAEVGHRNLWPQLTRADLHDLGGSVTKFEANLAAIRVLHQIEIEQRLVTPDEHGTLLRYTGWGGLPASFNLETEDAS